MKLISKSMVAVALFIGLAAIFCISTDAAFAATNVHQYLNGLDLGHLSLAAPVGLVALRKRLDKLTTRAADKMKEIKDDTSDEDARAIEEAHAEILAEAEEVRSLIAEIEGTPAGEGSEENQERGGNPGSADDATDASRAADLVGIADMARGQGVDIPVADVQTAIRNGVTADAFRAQLFERMAAGSRQRQTAPARGGGLDETETRRAGMVDALVYRMGGAELQGDAAVRARPFMQPQTLVAMAAQHLGHRGLLESVREREEVLSRAFHTTSDFPAIFGSAINTVLEQRYALAQPTYRRIAQQRGFADFRPHYAVKIGEFPMLEKLTESGEIKFGTFSEGKEQIAVVPYAKGISVSRQMLVNDRLGAIGQLLGGYGRTVVRFEEITFYAMMLSANTKLSDNQVVFHADHKNLATAGATISTTSVGAGRAAMRKQKGLDGATLNIQPSILLVSPDKETEAQQFITPVVVNNQANANPWSSTLTPIVAGELTGNAWYLFASPEESPVYQWGLLDGYAAPRIRMDEPFGTQGLRMTVEHDFGVGAIDFRGGYKNPGA
jgi:hypothetical protein